MVGRLKQNKIRLFVVFVSHSAGRRERECRATERARSHSRPHGESETEHIRSHSDGESGRPNVALVGRHDSLLALWLQIPTRPASAEKAMRGNNISIGYNGSVTE